MPTSQGPGHGMRREKNYANFLDDSQHLIAVTASANRSKGARGPEEWQPPDPAYWCWYATDWVLIKSTWGLSATEQEWNALAAMLDTCNQPLTVVIDRDSRPPMPATTPPSAPTTTFDPFGEDRNCGDFATHAEAQGFFLAAGGPGDDPHRLDSDGNGVVCASLP